MIALGADTVNSARGMMFALGCIQSRSCNTGRCPTGIATQNPSRIKALDVTDKGQRVANFHHEMILNLVELLAAAGLENLEQLEPKHINSRISGTVVKIYQELYPCITDRCLLVDTEIPPNWKEDWVNASSTNW